MFGMDSGGLVFMLVVLGVIFLPFFINDSLARSRGKNPWLILLLTCIFSWIVTLILVMLPVQNVPPKTITRTTTRPEEKKRYIIP
ncbi:MAG: hypothetical protein KJ990_12605 [Proteobacteria bacterium]|nr:hypothetical protein [Pseudomonadota bacterium]MBU1648221.1 hypothetical protein [Pseudomonadota bacterium]